MKVRMSRHIQLGDLVLAAFDEADRYSLEPRTVSWLASHAVAHLLEKQQVSLLATPLTQAAAPTSAPNP